MKKLISLFSSFLLLTVLTHLHAYDCDTIERRATIDVGSGSTKVSIADVDTSTQHIVALLFDQSFPVPYQASLERSFSNSFDEEIQSIGLSTFHEIKEITDYYQVEKIAAVATAAFRSASNGEMFAATVEKETGIPLQIISQKEEGVLAFFSGVAVSGQDLDDLIVWDIGTGSFQMTTIDENELIVFAGDFGSIPFRNYIIEVVQDNDLTMTDTPNPISEDDLKAADRFGRALGRKAYPIIKEKIKQPETTIMGIGRLFSNSIGPRGNNDLITRKDLRAFLDESINRYEDELNNPFAHVDVPNAIFVLAFMKALHIQEIHIADTKTTLGMLIYPSYWE